jgi:hypothetical protein
MNTPTFLTEPTPALSLDLPPSAPRRRARSGEHESRRHEERPPHATPAHSAPPAPAAALDEGTRNTWRAVYTIVERGGRRLWLRIGTAFINRDQSMNVRLDAVPVNGQFHIREAPPTAPPGASSEREPARDGVRPEPTEHG